MRARTLLRPMRSERGSSLVEMALVLPIFLMLTVALMDFSIAVWWQHTLANVAHEGARHAAVRQPTAAEVDQVVRNGAVGLVPQKLQVTTTWIPNNSPGSIVRVVVRYPFNPLTPFVPSSAYTLEGAAETVVLH